MRFKNNWNATAFDNIGEVNTEPSMTIPDQSMTVMQIIQRHRQGLKFIDGKVPIWHEDDEGNPLDLPDMKNMDLAEKQELLEYARERVEQIRADINMQEKLRRDLEQKKMAEQRKAEQEKAYQGPNVQRTTGDAGDQGTKP